MPQGRLAQVLRGLGDVHDERLLVGPQTLDDAGIELHKGDLLSLGGFIPPMPAQPNTSITVKYEGMLENPSVTVHFD